MNISVRKILAAISIIAIAEIFLTSFGVAQTIFPQNADDIHIGVTSCAGSTCQDVTPI